MNWYKLAITQKQIYDFYALQHLSDEALQERPDFVFNLISLISEMREEYLNILIQGIFSELLQAFIGGKNEQYIRLIQKYLPSYLPQNKIKASQELSQIKWQQINPADLNEIKKIFNNHYLWENSKFGGNAWVDIIDWFLRLRKTSPLPYPKVISKDFINKLREMVVLIDTIHSVYHNRSAILGDKLHWFELILEIVKNIDNPTTLAQLSKNVDLLKYYRNQSGKSTSRVDREKLYYDNLKGFGMEKLSKILLFALESKDLDLFKAVLKSSSPHETEFLYPKIFYAIIQAGTPFKEYYAHWINSLNIHLSGLGSINEFVWFFAQLKTWGMEWHFGAKDKLQRLEKWLQDFKMLVGPNASVVQALQQEYDDSINAIREKWKNELV